MSRDFYRGKNTDLLRNRGISNSLGMSPVSAPPVNQALDISCFASRGIFSPGGFMDTLEPSTVSEVVEQPSKLVHREESNITDPVVAVSRQKFQPRLVSGLPRANSTEPDLYACEKALVIDHILEKMFSYSDIESLKNFRLVCHRWRIFGAKELQNSVTIDFRKTDKNTFVFCKNDSNDNLDSCKGTRHRKTNNNSAENQLEALTLLMQSSSVFPYFPCKAFTFNAGNLDDFDLQNFFNIHGLHIKTLRLHLRYSNFRDCVLDMPALKRIVVEQVPNMESFQLQVRLHDGWENEDERHFQSVMNEAEEVQRNSESVVKRNTNFNYKLKNMEFFWELPRTVFETLVRLTPNLKQVSLDSRYMNYLIEPTNRIHLLKKIMVFLWHGNLDSWEKIMGHYEYIQLQEIGFYLSSINNTQPDVIHRVTAIINKILSSSCNSVEKVLWAPISLLPGIKIPRMPKVKQILFGDYWKTSEGQQFFPDSTNLAQIFPNLQTICFAFGFLSDSDLDTLTSCFSNFDPVPSVRYVYIKNADKLSPDFVEHLTNWFPNAKLV